MDLLGKAATVAMLIWVVFSMLAMGTGLTLARITERLRNVRLVLLALLANFVLMPIGAEALAKVLRVDEPVEVGLLLLGCAAGGPFLPTTDLTFTSRFTSTEASICGRSN